MLHANFLPGRRYHSVRQSTRFREAIMYGKKEKSKFVGGGSSHGMEIQSGLRKCLSTCISKAKNGKTLCTLFQKKNEKDPQRGNANSSGGNKVSETGKRKKRDLGNFRRQKEKRRGRIVSIDALAETRRP